jgi:alkaline phosphatase
MDKFGKRKEGNFMKKILALMLALLLSLGAMTVAAAETAATKTPKYVFMFIGDGMGSPQINATQYYLGTKENPDAAMPTPASLSFTNFENIGIMTTYDATSFCPDSASTATAMASGEKTLSGVVNYNADKTQALKIVTEYAKEAGKKVGVITTVSLDHATPAAYYAKAESRKQYYEIAAQGLGGATVDFFGGGAYLKPTGDNKDQKDVLEIAKENGLTVVDTVDGVRAITADSGRTLAISPDRDGEQAMIYEIDRERRAPDSLSLADFVKAGIANLDNDNGFFLMTEGGKIDWSCHANDAKTSIMDTVAFSDAVKVAIDFAAQHADETLIIVTGDHETGGLTIGFATTAYETHFNYLDSQTISYDEFDGVIAALREKNATFEDALSEIKTYYGLTTELEQPLTLTEAELAKLQEAFALSMQPADQRNLTDNDALLYGGYEPLSMAVSHIVNNKAGIAYTSYSHTGLQIPVYASGAGAELFQGSYDNTDIFKKTMQAMGLTA